MADPVPGFEYGTLAPVGGTSGDPVTDSLRKKMDHPFASRPLGGIDEEGQPIKEQMELADSIRVAVECVIKRRKNPYTTPRIREACELCLQFWRDVAVDPRHLWRNREDAAAVFGNPPRTNIVLSRLYDWQMVRIYLKKQRKLNGDAQGVMRDSLEEAWTGIVLVGG